MAESQPAAERKRRHRRVSRPAPVGSDPNPGEGQGELASEDDPKSWGDATLGSAPRKPNVSSENDERLKRDKPPHWGE